MHQEERQLLEEKYGGLASPAYEADRARLAAEEPLAYVIGSQPFLGLTIHLDSHPLIPRPETEWWTEELGRVIEGRLAARRRESQEFSSKKISVSREGSAEFRVLDLCAGSGAIGCALLKLAPGAHVSFGEIDPSHEATIRKNIRENNLDESRASIGIGNLFEPFAGEQFDIIAANPPYASTGYELPPSVARYEPMLAIQAGADGLDVMRSLAAGLPHHLAPGGEAWVEIDNDKPEAAQALFAAQGLAVTLREDQYGRPRLLVIKCPQ